MIDRAARDLAALLIEEFWRGAITNRELENGWPNSREKGILAVEDFVWTLYDDTRTHTVNDGDRSDPKLSAIIANCLSFLRSDEEYTWPHFGIIHDAEIYPYWAVLGSLGLLGLWNRMAKARQEQYWREMHAHGNVEHGRFGKRKTYNQAAFLRLDADSCGTPAINRGKTQSSNVIRTRLGLLIFLV